MKAFKGFDKELKNRLGSKVIQYEVGETYREPKSKTVNSGFHCCENPFECLSYYKLEDSAFCEVEAAGSIDEDDAERIACTEMTIVRELTRKQFAYEGLLYMVMHPRRQNWEQNYRGVKVGKEAIAEKEGDIAIARGTDPVVEAVKGSYIGIIFEPVTGVITAAHFKYASEDGIYSVDADGELIFRKWGVAVEA